MCTYDVAKEKEAQEMCDGGKNKGEAGAGGDGGSTFTPANVSVEDLYDLGIYAVTHSLYIHTR